MEILAGSNSVRRSGNDPTRCGACESGIGGGVSVGGSGNISESSGGSGDSILVAVGLFVVAMVVVVLVVSEVGGSGGIADIIDVGVGCSESICVGVCGVGGIDVNNDIGNNRTSDGLDAGGGGLRGGGSFSGGGVGVSGGYINVSVV
ncbi:glycine-rich protein 23-like [Octopus sinensis]|uniref:Glycine-rich protein 23-like n=1 Tax=Octopus sinensis TaxID=2607531 RepID=A0A6P7SN10_9MOLL|nr:glycine-rich protein 23-like [Octopus sinensis]